MNKNDRKDLHKAIDLMEEAKSIMESIKDGEQEKYDNLPETLQCTERGEKFEENASSLDDVIYELESIIGDVDEICNS